MSPVFRHGRLRLYLLKLLEEAPRHGYEVIRLLQDRFLGVYAPSPGTIYPRLARLEEEGMVTHDEVDGRKVYRITDKGREELRARYDDLAELEEEITASVRDIAQEVSEDVRATVRSLREELTSAARGMRAGARPGRRGRQGRQDRNDVWGQASSAHDQAREAAREQREQARAQRDQARAQRGAPPRAGGEPGHGSQDEAGSGGETGGETGWGWGDWPDWGDWGRRRGQAGRGWGDPRTYRDMERMARQFTREFHRAAAQAQAVGEEAVASLHDILDDAMDRIRSEVFGGPRGTRPGQPGPGQPGPGQPGPGQPGPGQPGPGQHQNHGEDPPQGTSAS